MNAFTRKLPLDWVHATVLTRTYKKTFILVLHFAYNNYHIFTWDWIIEKILNKYWINKISIVYLNDPYPI